MYENECFKFGALLFNTFLCQVELTLNELTEVSFGKATMFAKEKKQQLFLYLILFRKKNFISSGWQTRIHTRMLPLLNDHCIDFDL